MDYERNGCRVMNILIDIFLLLLIVLVVAGAARKNTARAAIRLAAVTAAVLALKCRAVEGGDMTSAS